MPLNEPQRAELAKILDSDLFKAAKEEVLRQSDGPVYPLLAPEQAMALAIEKGVRQAFRLLHKVCEPPREAVRPQLSSQLSHKRTA